MPSTTITTRVGLFALVALLFANTSNAQGLGIGPRMTFVRGDSSVDDSAARYSGGLLRLNFSPRKAIELSLDYRSHVNESLTERVRDYPIQASMLFYLARAGVAPYLLGGVGWYSQKVATLEQNQVISEESTRTFGYHAGLGGEMRLGRRAAAHLDYRYTFIHFGNDPASGETGAVPLPGLLSFQDKLKLSHKGSMWTTGVTVYF